MKICHVTYEHTSNYGSCLQEYALDEVLRKGGHEVELYQRDRSGDKGSLKARVGRILEKIIQRPGFKRFEQRRVRFTEPIPENDTSAREMIGQRYDAFITGSDVVWNTAFNRKRGYYYLGFTDRYKFSYAASFGKGTLNEVDEALARRYLPELDAISVREKSSAENAARFTEKHVEVVVDPVLLLEREEWEALAKPPQKDTPFIFVYSTFHSSFEIDNNEIRKYVNALEAKTGLKAIWVCWNIKTMIKDRLFRYPSPEEWLGLLKGAEYIVTTSFHAAAFSTIFQKNFVVFVHSSGRKDVGSRLYDFLEQFSLEGRIFSQCPAELLLEAPDFTLAKKKLPEMRRNSMVFLQENLEAAYREKQAREQGASVGS